MELMGTEEVCDRVEAAFNLLAKKWTGLIINALLAGELYFCELEKAIPALSARVLALRMRELEEEEVVVRAVSAGSPVRVSYALTEKGRALGPVIREIVAWAHSWSEPAAGPDALRRAWQTTTAS